MDRPQAIENSGQYLLPAEQIIYRKQSLYTPDFRGAVLGN